MVGSAYANYDIKLSIECYRVNQIPSTLIPDHVKTYMSTSGIFIINRYELSDIPENRIQKYNAGQYVQ